MSVDQNKNIVFTPDDPSFAGTLSFGYEVSIPSSSLDSATLTIAISGQTPSNINKNYLAVGEIVDSYCDPNSSAYNNIFSSELQQACNAYNTLTGDERINALATLSPEEVVAEYTSTVNMTKEQTGNLTNRLNALRAGATGVSVAGLNYYQGDEVFYGQWLHEMADQIGGNASAEQNFSPFGFFINGSISDGEKDTTDLEDGYDLEGNSITLGMDYRISESLVAGVAYGISDSEIEFTSSNDITNEVDNLLFYGTWYKDRFYVDGLFGYAKGDIETNRRIEFGPVNESVSGETESSQFFVSVTGSYDFSKGPWTYGPYAALDIIDGEIDGYEEVGGTGFEIGFDDQDIKSQILTFGGRVQYAWSQSWGIVIPHARVEWKNELEDERNTIVGRFVLDTSDNTFEIEADDLDDNWYQAAVGVSATFQHGLSAYVDYETIISYEDTDLETFSFGGRWETKF